MVGGKNFDGMEMCIPETDSEDEFVQCSQQTQSDEERYESLTQRNLRIASKKMEERRRAREVAEDSDSSEDEFLPPTNTRRPVRFGDGGECSNQNIIDMWARAKAREDRARGIDLDEIFDEELSVGSSLGEETDTADEEALPVPSQQPTFDLTVTSSSDESGDENLRILRSLPAYPELRRGPAFVGPPALSPPPPSPPSPPVVAPPSPSRSSVIETNE